MKASVLVLATSVVLLAVAFGQARSEPPLLVTYQGVLADSSGAVIDGSATLIFRLYEDSLAITDVWSETHPDVEVDGGLFSVVLGYQTPLTAALFEDGGQWLGIKVDDGPELGPRLRITSVPYAMRAAVSDMALSVPGGVLDGHSLDAVDGTPADVVYIDGDGSTRIGGGVVIGSGYAGLESGSADLPTPAAPEVRSGKSVVEARVEKAAAGPASGSDRRGPDELPVATMPAEPAVTTGQTPPVNGLIVEGSVGIGTPTPVADLDVAGTLQATALRLPSAPAVNYVLACDDTLGNASWRPNYGSRVPAIRYADQFPGTTAGRQIRAALLDLQAQQEGAGENGIVDARGLEGGTIDVNMFEGIDIHATLLLGAGTFTVDVPQVFAGSRDGSLRLSGEGLSTVIKPTASMAVFTVSGEGGRFASLQFDLNQTNSTAILFTSVHWFNGEIEHVKISGCAGPATILKLGEDWESAGALGAWVRDVDIWGSMTQVAIEVHAEMVLIDDCNISQCHVCVMLDGGTSSTISNSALCHSHHSLLIDQGTYDTLLFQGNDCEAGFNNEGFIRIIGSAAYFPVRNVIIRDNYFTQMNNPEADAIYLKNVVGATIEANRFAGGFPGSGAESVVFGTGVSEVCLGGNIVIGIEPSMPGYQDAGLQVNDVTAMQTSQAGGFGQGLTVGGVLSAIGTVRFEPRQDPPPDPSEGDAYMDADTHKLMVFDGTTWRACW